MTKERLWTYLFRLGVSVLLIAILLGVILRVGHSVVNNKPSFASTIEHGSLILCPGDPVEYLLTTEVNVKARIKVVREIWPDQLTVLPEGLSRYTHSVESYNYTDPPYLWESIPLAVPIRVLPPGKYQLRVIGSGNGRLDDGYSVFFEVEPCE